MKKYLHIKSGIAAFILIALASCLQSQPTDSRDHVVEIDSTEFPISTQQQGAYFLLKSSEDKLSLNIYQEDKIVSVDIMIATSIPSTQVTGSLGWPFWIPRAAAFVYMISNLLPTPH